MVLKDLREILGLLVPKVPPDHRVRLALKARRVHRESLANRGHRE